jgi:hypothetical protein
MWKLTRLGPGLVEPVAGVGGSLASLLGNILVVGSKFLKEGISLSWLRNGNAVLVSEGLELGVLRKLVWASKCSY